MSISLQRFNAELFTKARKAKIPVTGTFELTGRCNLACLMCYVRRNPSDKAAISSELSAKQWLDIGRQAADEGLLYLLLTGGEPFLRPDFFDIYEGLHKLGLKISINTNATMITPEIACRLAASPPIAISVTLYGASPQTYGRICGDSGAYDRTIRGIELLCEQGLTVRLRTTIIRQNREDFNKLYETALRFGTKFQLVDYVFANRENSGTDPYAVRLSPTEQFACLRKLADMLAQDNPNHTAAPDAPQKTKRDESAFSCAAGHFSFAVSYSGKLAACLMIDDLTLPLTEGASFKEQWRKLVELCSHVPVCGDCAACGDKKYCTVCPAKLKGETGFFDRKAPYLCDMARIAAESTASREVLKP